MVANRAYKFRIYPNDEQKILFAKTFGCVRMVYNHWLDRKIRQYEENKTNVTYTICAKEMAAMKKTIFSLGGWAPRLPTGLLVSCGTLDSRPLVLISTTGLLPSLVGSSKPLRL